jgi:hypothetical protein
MKSPSITAGPAVPSDTAAMWKGPKGVHFHESALQRPRLRIAGWPKLRAAAMPAAASKGIGRWPGEAAGRPRSPLGAGSHLPRLLHSLVLRPPLVYIHAAQRGGDCVLHPHILSHPADLSHHALVLLPAGRPQEVLPHWREAKEPAVPHGRGKGPGTAALHAGLCWAVLGCAGRHTHGPAL